jgi:hypothetical protein
MKGLTGVRFISDGSTSQIEQMVPEFNFALVPNISVDFGQKITSKEVDFVKAKGYELVLNLDTLPSEVMRNVKNIETFMNELEYRNL